MSADGTYPEQRATPAVTTTNIMAAELTMHGFKVFRLVAGEKYPRNKGWQTEATDSFDAVLAWPASGYNIGISCASFVVIDADAGKGGLASLEALRAKGLLPRTRTHRTARGGFHLIYRAPPGRRFANRNYWKRPSGVEIFAISDYPGIDIKSDGGLIVAPGSTFEGKPYVCEDAAPIADLHGGLADLLAIAPVRSAQAGEPVCELDTPWAIGEAIRYLRVAEVAVQGNAGDPQTIKVANRILDFGLSNELALELMADHWNDRCSPPWDLDDLDKKIASAARSRQSPIGRDHPARAFTVIEATPVAAAAPVVPPDDEQLVVTLASAVKPKNPEWLWPSRIARGKLNLVAGDQGLGKTTVLLDIIARITTGAEWPCGEGRAPKGSVIFMGTEDALDDTIAPRLIAADADLDRVSIISAVKLADGKGQRSFSLATDLSKLEELIRKIGDVLLVVVDPLNSYFGRDADTYRTSDVRTVLEPVAEMAARMGVTIIGNSHLGKDSKGRSANLRILDSQAITAVARGISIVAPDPDNPGRRLFMRSKGSNAKEGLPALAYVIRSKIIGIEDTGDLIEGTFPEWSESSVAVSADEVFGRLEKKGRPSPKRDAAEAFLLTYLANGPKPANGVLEAAAAHAISLSTLQDAKNRLGIIPEKIGLTDGWSWQLPPAKFPMPF